MLKRYVTLPKRSKEAACKGILETNPDDWEVRLIGRVIIPSAKQFLKGNKYYNNNLVLAVFQDKLSKKVFFWQNTREHSEHQTLRFHHQAQNVDECRYHFWPNEMIQVTGKNYKTFLYYIKGFGAEYDLTKEEQEKVDAQKDKLIDSLKAMANE